MRAVTDMQQRSDWVTLLASNDRRGGTSAARSAAPTELIWKATLADAVRSSPVLYEGVVYVTCRNGRLYAFDSRTGKERWTLQAAAPMHSTPSIAANLVLAGCDDGCVYAVERSSGRLQWKAEGGGPDLDLAHRPARHASTSDRPMASSAPPT